VLNWFRAIMPKEERFFDVFEQHSKLVVVGAEALRAGPDGGGDLDRHVTTVMDRENDAEARSRRAAPAS
jgi:uncharacterized protein